jgi:hypothetical protein
MGSIFCPKLFYFYLLSERTTPTPDLIFSPKIKLIKQTVLTTGLLRAIFDKPLSNIRFDPLKQTA